jgi:hypothetical protein
MAIQLTDNSADLNGAAVNTDHELKTALTQDSSKSGFTAMVSEKGIYPNGDRLMRELEVSEDYRLRAEGDNLWLADYPLGTAVNTRKWATLLSASQTITVGGARYELNSSGLTTANSGSMLKSYKFIPFYKANATYIEFAVNWTLDPLANWFAEWGVGNPTSAIAAQTDGIFFRITAGQFRGVCVNNSVESYVDLGTVPPMAAVHDFVIEATMSAVHFWHDGSLLGTVSVPDTQFGPTSQSGLPVFIRTYNAAIAPASAIKLQCSAIGASNGGADLNRLWPTVQTGMGNSAVQNPTGTAVGQTANYANAAAPASVTLAAAGPGYTTLGGQFQFAAVAGSETDYVVFGYQVPAGNTLIVRGLWIDTMNTGAAVATSATWLQWALGVGTTAVTLATADGAATKSAARLFLGNQVFPIAAAIGAQAIRIDVNLDAPQVYNSGEFVQLILKMPLGTATPSMILRGGVGFNAYFE